MSDKMEWTPRHTPGLCCWVIACDGGYKNMLTGEIVSGTLPSLVVQNDLVEYDDITIVENEP